MLRSLLLITALFGSLGHALTCEGLFEHQRAAVARARDARFKLRVFTRQIAGQLRTVVIAGQHDIYADDHARAGYSLKSAFPELVLTRRAENRERTVTFWPRPSDDRQIAAAGDLLVRWAPILEKLKPESRTLEAMADRLPEIFFKLKQHARVVFAYPFVVLKDAGEKIKVDVKHQPAPAPQLTFDVEADYRPTVFRQIQIVTRAVAKELSFLTSEVQTWVATGLVAFGAWMNLSTHGDQGFGVIFAGGAWLSLQAASAYVMAHPPSPTPELMRRNQFVAHQLEGILVEDRDVSELLVLTETSRVDGVAEALAQVGFEEHNLP